ncbi:MAG TPA: hypothetical protein VG963_03145 [Polyangiaceae bacterium]|nr:hypothetical protein [Polyangiaceae bacterium]
MSAVSGREQDAESAGEHSEQGSLEREVAAIDAASTAFSASRFGYALDLLAEYRRDFPHGELARDADVIEIEALFGKGERVLARRRAQRFLALYPGDVHAGRLRSWAAATANAEREPERMPAP